MEQDNKVKSTFDEVAQDYDMHRRALIPCFDGFYGTAAALALVNTETPSILDLGAGTGLLSGLLLERFPQAEATLVDLSENMLELARSRLRKYPHVQYRMEDYLNLRMEGAFDLVVSALSIHHLDDAGKQTLYRNSFANLKDNGVFINADQVLGETRYLDALYKDDWKRKIEASGLSQEQLDAAYERTKIDRMSTLDQQLGWLRDVGFKDVDCVFKSYNFVVLYGRKYS